MSKVRTRDQAREYFNSAGLDYSVISRPNLQCMRNMVNEKMKKSGLLKGSYRCHQRPKLSHDAQWADIRCKSFYFDDRQAVTFEKDGFIGFAGWADSENIKPILEGFVSWVDQMSKAPLITKEQEA